MVRVSLFQVTKRDAVAAAGGRVTAVPASCSSPRRHRGDLLVPVYEGATTYEALRRGLEYRLNLYAVAHHRSCDGEALDEASAGHGPDAEAPPVDGGRSTRREAHPLMGYEGADPACRVCTHCAVGQPPSAASSGWPHVRVVCLTATSRHALSPPARGPHASAPVRHVVLADEEVVVKNEHVHCLFQVECVAATVGTPGKASFGENHMKLYLSAFDSAVTLQWIEGRGRSRDPVPTAPPGGTKHHWVTVRVESHPVRVATSPGDTFADVIADLQRKLQVRVVQLFDTTLAANIFPCEYVYHLAWQLPSLSAEVHRLDGSITGATDGAITLTASDLGPTPSLDANSNILSTPDAPGCRITHARGFRMRSDEVHPRRAHAPSGRSPAGLASLGDTLSALNGRCGSVSITQLVPLSRHRHHSVEYYPAMSDHLYPEGRDPVEESLSLTGSVRCSCGIGGEGSPWAALPGSSISTIPTGAAGDTRENLVHAARGTPWSTVRQRSVEGSSARGDICCVFDQGRSYGDYPSSTQAPATARGSDSGGSGVAATFWLGSSEETSTDALPRSSVGVSPQRDADPMLQPRCGPTKGQKRPRSPSSLSGGGCNTSKGNPETTGSARSPTAASDLSSSSSMLADWVIDWAEDRGV